MLTNRRRPEVPTICATHSGRSCWHTHWPAPYGGKLVRWQGCSVPFGRMQRCREARQLSLLRRRISRSSLKNLRRHSTSGKMRSLVDVWQRAASCSVPDHASVAVFVSVSMFSFSGPQMFMMFPMFSFSVPRTSFPSMDRMAWAASFCLRHG